MSQQDHNQGVKIPPENSSKILGSLAKDSASRQVCTFSNHWSRENHIKQFCLRNKGVLSILGGLSAAAVAAVAASAVAASAAAAAAR